MNCPHCGKPTGVTGNPYQAARIASGLTLTEASRKTGITYQVIWSYESGDREPGMPIARKLATAYKCSLDTLVGLISTSQQEPSGETH